MQEGASESWRAGYALPEGGEPSPCAEDAIAVSPGLHSLSTLSRCVEIRLLRSEAACVLCNPWHRC